MFGFYDNFFAMIEKAYDELGRPPGAPLATWREAFHPGEIGVLESFHDNVWTPFIITLPRNQAVPGQGAALLSSKAYFALLLGGALMATLGWQVTADIEDRLFPNGKPPTPTTSSSPASHCATTSKDRQPLPWV